MLGSRTTVPARNRPGADGPQRLVTEHQGHKTPNNSKAFPASSAPEGVRKLETASATLTTFSRKVSWGVTTTALGAQRSRLRGPEQGPLAA